jgi:hypothetical protein
VGSISFSANNVVPAWINLVIGGWMTVSGWVLGYADVPAVLWDGLIVGLEVGRAPIARAMSCF